MTRIYANETNVIEEAVGDGSARSRLYFDSRRHTIRVDSRYSRAIPFSVREFYLGIDKSLPVTKVRTRRVRRPDSTDGPCFALCRAAAVPQRAVLRIFGPHLVRDICSRGAAVALGARHCVSDSWRYLSGVVILFVSPGAGRQVEELNGLKDQWAYCEKAIRALGEEVRVCDPITISQPRRGNSQ